MFKLHKNVKKKNFWTDLEIVTPDPTVTGPKFEETMCCSFLTGILMIVNK